MFMQAVINGKPKHNKKKPFSTDEVMHFTLESMKPDPT